MLANILDIDHVSVRNQVSKRKVWFDFIMIEKPESSKVCVITYCSSSLSNGRPDH